MKTFERGRFKGSVNPVEANKSVCGPLLERDIDKGIMEKVMLSASMSEALREKAREEVGGVSGSIAGNQELSDNQSAQVSLKIISNPAPSEKNEVPTAESEAPVTSRSKREHSDLTDKHCHHDRKKHKHDEKKLKMQVVPAGGPFPERTLTVCPDESWTGAQNYPIQLFNGFRLAQDTGYYQNFTREEIQSRNLLRLGRFVSDLLYIQDTAAAGHTGAEYARLKSQAEELQVALESEKKAKGEAMKKLEELSSLQEVWKTEKQGLLDKAKGAIDEADAKGNEIADQGRQIAELKASHEQEINRQRESFEKTKQDFTAQVKSLEEKLAQCRLESVNSFETGFNASVNRFAARGVDLTGMDFSSYQVSLEEATKDAGKACEHPSRRPRRQNKRKTVAADSSVSEKTLPSVSRIHGQARRRVNRNDRDHGKLDDVLLNKYLGTLWQSISSDKKDSSAYIDCLLFTMYHKESDKQKVLRWIRRERIFSKKYVFLPICRWGHWSLLIFCHMGEDLQTKTTTPCMLLLDSLHDADPRRLEPDIRKFLLDIHKVEGRPETKQQIDKIPLLVPKVPQQNDNMECGYYVLYYISLFLMSSPETFSISDGYPYFMSEDWFTAEELKSFCKTLPSFDRETGLGDDLCDDASDDDVLLIE